MKTFLVVDHFMDGKRHYDITESQLNTFLSDLWPQCDPFTSHAIDELVTMKLYDGDPDNYVCEGGYPPSLFYGLGVNSGKSGYRAFHEHLKSLESFLLVSIYEEI